MSRTRACGTALVLALALTAWGFPAPAPAAEPAAAPLCLPTPAAPAGRFEPPTMAVMNSATARRRLEKGFFAQVFRGFGTRKADRIGRDELLGFHFLLDTDCQSHGLRALIRKHAQAGLSAAAALEAARREHVGVLRQTFARIESLGDLYENYRGKGEILEKTGLVDPESHFIFTSPHLSVARFYGPIVLVIEENIHRGLDLNGIARDARYYTIARFLQNLADLQFRAILADYVTDRDEYVLPSYLTPGDVTGLIVHDPSPVVIANRVAVPPPAVRRVYRKHLQRGAMTIDVFDGRDRLIARLCPAPSAADPDPGVERSPDRLPPDIQAAWNAHVARLRRPGRRPAP